MADQITTITDKSQMNVIFTNYFAKQEVYLKTKSGDLKVYFLGYDNEHAAIRIPKVKNVPDILIVFTRNELNTIYCSLKYFERNEDTFIFIPIKFQIISFQKKEDRTLVSTVGSGGKNVFYMYNYFSDFYIRNSLEMNNKKNDQVKEIVMFDLQKHYKNIKIVFLHEAKNDIRLKYALESKLVIFVPDLNSDPDPKYANMYKFYLDNIYGKDLTFGGKKYNSEITVPVMYRNIIPYGYIQVNNPLPLTEGDLAVIKRMSIVIDQLFVKNKLFNHIENKFLISDISAGGLGVVFKDRGLARHFKKDSLCYFEVMLPTSKKAVIGAFVRNITFVDNTLIKIGFQNSFLDEISKQNYDEYLALTTQKNNPVANPAT